MKVFNALGQKLDQSYPFTASVLSSLHMKK